jgi:hypothetical protein
MADEGSLIFSFGVAGTDVASVNDGGEETEHGESYSGWEYRVLVT